MSHGEFIDKLTAFLKRILVGFESIVDVDRLSGGASQETYRVVCKMVHGNRTLAARRAAGGGIRPRSLGHPGLRAEALLMRCAREADIPAPEIVGIFGESDELGDGFVMEWIDGETLGSRLVRGEEFAALRRNLAFQCGQILARIHSIDVEASGLINVLDKLSPAEFLDDTWRSYRELQTPQPMIDYTACWLKANLPRSSRTTLVHNDFRIGNLIANNEKLLAVLDWELAHIGDPMRDLGWLCTRSWRFGGSKPVGGFGEYADLFAGYESVSGQRVDPTEVHYWEVFGSFWWACNTLVMAAHYRSGPDKSVEQPAIGRRSSECQIDCVNLLIPGTIEPPAPITSTAPMFDERQSNLPRVDELIHSVRDFLRDDIATATQGRTHFLAKVASNSLNIVLREIAFSETALLKEHSSLERLLETNGDLNSLRWKLVEKLRNGAIPLESSALTQHLRQAVANQVAIDQPQYPGLKTALEHSKRCK